MYVGIRCPKCESDKVIWRVVGEKASVLVGYRRWFLCENCKFEKWLNF